MESIKLVIRVTVESGFVAYLKNLTYSNIIRSLVNILH